MATNKKRYRRMLEIMARAERGIIIPVFNHLKNLNFLLITLDIGVQRSKLKLLNIRLNIK